jgi:hypothetical protein
MIFLLPERSRIQINALSAPMYSEALFIRNAAHCNSRVGDLSEN